MLMMMMGIVKRGTDTCTYIHVSMMSKGKEWKYVSLIVGWLVFDRL